MALGMDETQRRDKEKQCDMVRDRIFERVWNGEVKRGERSERFWKIIMRIRKAKEAKGGGFNLEKIIKVRLFPSFPPFLFFYIYTYGLWEILNCF